MKNKRIVDIGVYSSSSIISYICLAIKKESMKQEVSENIRVDTTANRRLFKHNSYKPIKR